MKLLEIKKPSEDIISQVNSLDGEKGKIVAIETETEEWFLGENVITALKNARSKFPNGIFYFTRVGYPAAHEHKDDVKRL